MTHHITRHKKLFGNHQNFLSLFFFFAINKFKNYFIKKNDRSVHDNRDYFHSRLYHSGGHL